MWNLKHIEIKDFFSHVHSEYDFKNGCCTLIVGKNLDKGGNNGAGKTTLFEAITVALTGKSLRDLKKESFINDDAEQCAITLDLTNSVLKQELSVRRQFYRGNKSAKVEIWENGELNTHITSVLEADKRILELIGISREDLLRYFIISQDNVYTFFTAADNEKKEVLNRITSADMINPIVDKLSEDKKDREGKMRELESRLGSIDSREETLTEQLNELRSNDDKSDEIKVLVGEIKSLENERNGKIEHEIKEVTERKEKAEAEYDQLGKLLKDTSTIEQTIRKYDKKIKEYQQEGKENNKIIKIGEIDLSGAVSCPNCGENFIPKSQLNLSVEETREIVNQAKEANSNIDKRIEHCEKEIEKLESKLQEQDEIVEKREKLHRKIQNFDSDIKLINDEVVRIEKKINRRKSEIKELKENRQTKDLIASVQKKIDECKSERESITNEITPLSNELDEINFWKYNMGRSGFQTFLANRAVAVIEGSTNSYLQKFHSDISVNINGFTILRDGTIREKIDVYALENGMNPKPYMGRSGGERSRIKLAGILAIQHLINMSLSGKGLDFLCLDESLSGLDADGTIAFINVLNNVGSTIMMITQNVEDASIFENILMVEKKNGVSHYTTC